VAYVLVVDDDSDLRDVFVEFLAQEGYTAGAVENAQEALVVLAQKTPTVRPELTGTALVVVSGARDLAEQAHALGAAGWLRKPFAFHELLQTVGACCAPRETPRVATS
jgi:CheY-like chemotaxis protein